MTKASQKRKTLGTTASEGLPWEGLGAKRRSGRRFVVVLVILLLGLVQRIYSPLPFTILGDGDASTLEIVEESFNWDDLEPSTSLNWQPCFSEYQCARLSVPLNWNSTVEGQENGPRAAVAVIRLPAKVPIIDPQYGGPIMLNPGGPGESGVSQVLSDGKNFQALLDSPLPPSTSPLKVDARDAGGKYFDIWSFDPRGVNNTTPPLRCFSSAAHQQAWLLSSPDYGLLWHSERTIGMEWARAEALGSSCTHGDDLETGIIRFSNTAQVVEDMLQMIETEGEWRDKEAKRLLQDSGLDDDAVLEIIERTAYRPGEEMLQFWGKSYGTLIGSTFAAMHPDRVGRVVLDGVVDPADHYVGGYMTQLDGSDAIISKFCEYCAQAGPGRCSLASPGASAEDIEARFTNIMVSLRESPIAVPPSGIKESGSPAMGFVTYGDLHLMLLSAMYFSFAMVDALFEVLPDIEARNTSTAAMAHIISSRTALVGSYSSYLDGDMPYVSQMGPFQTISCMDAGGGPETLTRHEFNDFLDVLQAQGRWISPSWARNKLSCLGVTHPPAWKPDLTFKTQEWANTSHPLLFLGNTHDTRGTPAELGGALLALHALAMHGQGGAGVFPDGRVAGKGRDV
ncbi:hypothetical protein PT974_07566 [Cladobotryum mycophilum]|uniref:AB hydrolase-1 domain-containing protein n=1 Tax=Cladobotryum mycophilum TaxID=491253 RepID=A0ABR0SQT5_9HYPO